MKLDNSQLRSISYNLFMGLCGLGLKFFKYYVFFYAIKGFYVSEILKYLCSKNHNKTLEIL